MVGQHPVHPGHRRGAGQAEVADLHRRRAVAEDARARAAGQALQVDEHVDAGLRDELGRRDVVDAGQPRMVIERAQDALALRLLRLRRPANAPDLEAAAVVQLEELGREQAHGVQVQVARQVADADAAAAQRHGGVQRRRRRLGHFLMHEALRRQQLQRGVVVQAHHRQQRGAHQELVRRHRAHGQVVRPGALLLADVHVVLDDVGLGRIELQAAAHQHLGFGVAARRLEQPSAVVERVQAQIGADRGIATEDGAPHLQRAFGIAAALAQVAQVEPRRREARTRGQCLLVGGLRCIVAAECRQQRAPVETGHVAQRRRGVRQPGVVEQRRGLGLASVVQRLGRLHQGRQAQLPAARSGQPCRGLGRQGGNGRGGRRGGGNGNIHRAPPGVRFLAC